MFLFRRRGEGDGADANASRGSRQRRNRDTSETKAGSMPLRGAECTDNISNLTCPADIERTQAEQMARLQTHGKQHMSETLMRANDEWKNRQAARRETEALRFRSLDTDGSGELSLDELIAGAAILRITEGEAGDLFNTLDIDKSGSVSLEEFLKVYKTNTTATLDLGRVGYATEASRNALLPCDLSSAEFVEKLQRDGKKMTSSALTKASDDWKERTAQGTVTVANDIGRLGVVKVGACFREGEHADADATPDAEHAAYMQIHQRKFMGDTLVKAKEDWTLRAANGLTVPDDIGTLGFQKELSKYHKGESSDANIVPTSEFQIYLEKNKKKILSEDLSKANSSWVKRQAANLDTEMQRFRDIDTDGSGDLSLKEVIAGASLLHITPEQAETLFKQLDTDFSGSISMEEYLAKYRHATVALGIGHAGIMTAASSKPFCNPDADNTPEAEFIQYLRTHQRELLSDELAKQREIWEKRRAANEATSTKPDIAGHYADSTEASRRLIRTNSWRTHIPEAEQAAYSRKNERKLLSDELEKQSAEWTARAPHKKPPPVSYWDKYRAACPSQNVYGNENLSLVECLQATPYLSVTALEVEKIYRESDPSGSRGVHPDEFLYRYQAYLKTTAHRVLQDEPIAATEMEAKTAKESRERLAITLSEAKEQWRNRLAQTGRISSQPTPFALSEARGQKSLERQKARAAINASEELRAIFNGRKAAAEINRSANEKYHERMALQKRRDALRAAQERQLGEDAVQRLAEGRDRIAGVASVAAVPPMTPIRRVRHLEPKSNDELIVAELARADHEKRVEVMMSKVIAIREARMARVQLPGTTI